MTKLNDRIERRQGRVRGLLRRAAGERKRLSVYRSSKHIYAQVIDDDRGITLASASSIEKPTRETLRPTFTAGRTPWATRCWTANDCRRSATW